MGQSLLAAGNEVVFLGPLRNRFRYLLKAVELSVRLLRIPKYSATREPLLLRNFARQVEGEFRNGNYDIVVGGGPELSEVSPSIPTAIWADGTYRSVSELYPEFQGYCSRTRLQGERTEALILSKCRAAIYSNDWGARSAQLDYGVAANRLFVVPYGANLDLRFTSEQVGDLIKSRCDRRPWQLLFVGVNWTRKGGDIAVSVTRQLRRSIPDIKLVIVGCSPSLAPEDLEFCDVRGSLDKANPEEMAAITLLYQQSHAFILPTRADCAPVAFAEAASFGLPSFGTDVGGVQTLINDGETGMVFSLDDSAEEWAERLKAVLLDKSLYVRLSQGAYALWREKLNWKSAGERITAILAQVCKAE